jgi:hypothetical protein
MLLLFVANRNSRCIDTLASNCLRHC